MLQGAVEGRRGPLAELMPGFAERLAALGYFRSAARARLRMVAELDCWLAEEDVELGDLVTVLVEPFLERRQEAGVRLRTGRALIALVEYLQEIGRLGDLQPVVAMGPAEVLVERYRRYLLHERGLVEGTVAGYVRVARGFLVEQKLDGVLELATLRAVIEAEDWDRFEAVFAEVVRATNRYHVEFEKGFLVWKVPEDPPHDLDLTPQ